MNFEIYFCADGILRAKYSDKKPMIPLKFIQEQHKQNDFQFWVRWWNQSVFLEEGLTVGKFMICLEPWTEFFTELTNTNLSAYFAELRKPFVVKNHEKNSQKDERIFDWVNILYRSELSPRVEYLHDDNEESNFEDWLNQPQNQRLNGKWDLESSYVINGFHTGEEEHYGIDYTPMNELANVPIFLAKDHQIYLTSFHLKEHLGKNADLFKKNAFGVNSIVQKGFKNRKFTYKFLLEEKTHIFREVVEGFFYWMYYEPSTRDDFIETLVDIKDNLKNIRSEDLEEILEQDKKENNVISLNSHRSKETDVENIEKSITETKEDDKLKVKVAPGAFDGLIASYEKDKDFWENMLKAATKDNNVILKVGKTTLGEQPENRMFGMIISPDDKNANPQPSEYKKL